MKNEPWSDAKLAERFSVFRNISPATGALKLLQKRFLIGAGILTLFLSLTPWQQTVSGEGQVIAFDPSERTQSIDAPIEGRLSKWFVQEGSYIREGDPIVELTDNDPEILSRLRVEKTALEQRLKASRLSTTVARKNLDRQQELFTQGLASKRTVELAEIDLARFLADESNSSAELARLEVRLARQSNQLITANRAGTILRRRTGEATDLVKAGEQIAILVPDTASRAVEMWIDGNDMPLVALGREVRLQFEGWPAVQFSGWPAVAVGTFPGVITLIDITNDGSGKFRILVGPKPGAQDGELWPDTRYLRQGVRAHGWVLLEQVTVGYELWRRFNDFPPSLREKEGAETKKKEKDQDGGSS
jgi:multidrug efflux pump subunit AcrA (membrane-fusion protein)